MQILYGNLVDIFNERIFSAKITIEDDRIIELEKCDNRANVFIMPGFIDSHVHIESSMLTPMEFSNTAIKHGTISAITDPHEIANVLGIEGVDFMIKNSKKAKAKLFFGAPSCVPATNLETSGAKISANDIKELLRRKEIKLLSEMMNFPGVLSEDKEALTKIKIAKHYGKPIDGHAPGLKGKNLMKYINAGISTDHECTSLKEAEEKISLGMKILIREGSAAKNFDSLIDLLDKYPEKIMFCTDDIHPDDFINDHINCLVKRAIDKGKNIFDILKAASLNAVNHYNLEVGLLRKGDYADFIVVDNLKDLDVLETWISGKKVYDKNELIHKENRKILVKNYFNIGKINKKELIVTHNNESKIRVIEAIDDELITNEKLESPFVKDGEICQNIDNDILKIVVVNRYKRENPAVGFIKNIGIKKGAFASSIAHDSHNLIAVGATDEDLLEAINIIIENKGGIAVVNGKAKDVFPLPIAGIISDKSIEEVAKRYSELTKKVKELGSTLKAPFMTLSFMALIVIPKLKISNRGLFDVEKFKYVELGMKD